MIVSEIFIKKIYWTSSVAVSQQRLAVSLINLSILDKNAEKVFIAISIFNIINFDN